MPTPLTPSGKYLRDLVRTMPDAPALTIAKIAYRKHPEMWSSLENCRTAVRYILGVNGKINRVKNGDRTLYRKPRPAGWNSVIPKVRRRQWSPFVIEGEQRILMFSDIHFPFHDEQALELALEYGKKRDPSAILLNGDTLDFYQISNFERDPRERKVKYERKCLRYFLRGLRQRFPRCDIYYKLGNHDERYERYMIQKAPELLDIPNFKFELVFGLKKYGVTMISDKRPIETGKLRILHGHEYKFNISNPVNPARGIYMRAKVNCVAAHFHQTSQHSEPDLDGHVTSAWSTGCLCDLHPNYMPLNRWNLGFAFIEVDAKGAFKVDNLRIIDGRVW